MPLSSFSQGAVPSLFLGPVFWLVGFVFCWVRLGFCGSLRALSLSCVLFCLVFAGFVSAGLGGAFVCVPALLSSFPTPLPFLCQRESLLD